MKVLVLSDEAIAFISKQLKEVKNKPLNDEQRTYCENFLWQTTSPFGERSEMDIFYLPPQLTENRLIKVIWEIQQPSQLEVGNVISIPDKKTYLKQGHRIEETMFKIIHKKYNGRKLRMEYMVRPLTLLEIAEHTALMFGDKWPDDWI